jgi:hypothetical protein
MSRITDTLSAPQTARARMRAGSGFEAEASVTVTPMGLLAVGGLVGAILISVVPIVRAARRRAPPISAPEPLRLTYGEPERT